MSSKVIGRTVLAVALTVAAGAGASAWARERPSAGATVNEKAPDRVIFKSGRIVDGKITAETDTTITMTVVVGTISAPTTYQKADILEVKRGVNMAAGGEADAAAPATPAPPQTGETPSQEKAPASTSADESAAKLYIVELKDRFGFEVSETPLRRAFEEADKEFNDLVPGTGKMAGKRVVDPAKRQQNIVVLKMETFSEPGFSTIFRAEDLAPIVKEQIVEKGRRVVFWVELAAGGAAFFPWVSEDIYFTPDGRLGGIADLDKFSTGDKMVDEKLISAFLGKAEGFAIKGGYGAHVPALQAMIRTQLWLAVKFEGGRPVYMTRQPEEAKDGKDWVVLSDDGDGDNKDESALEGNDLFILESDWAEKLGISDGTAETIDDLAFRLGVQRNYVAIEKNRANRAFTEWKDGLESLRKRAFPPGNANVPPGELWEEYGKITDGGDFAERKKARGRRLTILRELRSIYTKYKEVQPGQLEAMIAQLDVMMAEIQLAAERDARAERDRNSGGNQ
ncbi:MAG: hypothetical protein SFZ24_08275 [Planctomycetota bacterium]|nr:hypothetical protein [Planctomycetota bacterium]